MLQSNKRLRVVLGKLKMDIGTLSIDYTLLTSGQINAKFSYVCEGYDYVQLRAAIRFKHQYKPYSSAFVTVN